MRTATGTFRFSINTLLGVVAAIAGFIAAVTQLGLGGFLLFVCVLGAALAIIAACKGFPNLGIVGVGMSLVTAPVLFSASRWTSESTHDVQVIVADADTGALLPGARVCIVRKTVGQQPPASVTETFFTNRAGRATVPARFVYSGQGRGLKKRETLWLWEHQLVVELHGYQVLQTPLYDFTGKTTDRSAGIPPIRVKLAPIDADSGATTRGRTNLAGNSRSREDVN